MTMTDQEQADHELVLADLRQLREDFDAQQLELEAARSRYEAACQLADERETRNEHLQARVTELLRLADDRLAAHEKDILTIGSHMMAEAERREWCSQYDEVVDDLNRHLRIELPIRRTTSHYRVQFDVYLETRPGDVMSAYNLRSYIVNELGDAERWGDDVFEVSLADITANVLE